LLLVVPLVVVGIAVRVVVGIAVGIVVGIAVRVAWIIWRGTGLTVELLRS
jgi:hypothetical protein